MKLLVIFIVLNVINVILQTIKSLCTVKCGKTIAAIVNAIAYSLYTVVIIYTVCDLSTFTKALVVGLCNLVGVYIVKAIEEKTRKDKLWLVKVTIPKAMSFGAKEEFTENNISYSVIDTNGFKVFDCYCATQAETTKVLEIAKKFDGKTFATENKLW